MNDDGHYVLFEPDPVLVMRLKPNAAMQREVLGRSVTLEVDAAGCRPVSRQPASGEKTLAVYGCSWVYGSALGAEEAFCSLLQSIFPRWRVENHGVEGYGTVHNLIQLRRNSRWSPADHVTFCWIPEHLQRNVAELAYLRNFMRDAPPHLLRRPWPRAGLNVAGDLQLRSVIFPRFDLERLDLDDFAPDAHYMDLVCGAVIRRANEIVTGHGGHFFVTALLDPPSPWLATMLAAQRIPVVQAALPAGSKQDAAASCSLARSIADHLERVRSS